MEIVNSKETPVKDELKNLLEEAILSPNINTRLKRISEFVDILYELLDNK